MPENLDPREVLPLSEVLERVWAFQLRTFPKATPASVAAHLEREVRELRERPTDPQELADVAILLTAVAHLSGVDLALAVDAKLAMLEVRAWGEPDAEGVVEHVKGRKMTGAQRAQLVSRWFRHVRTCPTCGDLSKEEPCVEWAPVVKALGFQVGGQS